VVPKLWLAKLSATVSKFSSFLLKASVNRSRSFEIGASRGIQDLAFGSNLFTRLERGRDHYNDNEDDSVWLPDVASKEWVIISQNQFNELERQASRNAGGRAF
jgi:hypothetical protein